MCRLDPAILMRHDGIGICIFRTGRSEPEFEYWVRGGTEGALYSGTSLCRIKSANLIEIKIGNTASYVIGQS